MMVSRPFLDLRSQLHALIRDARLAAMGGELEDGGLEGFGTEVGSNGITELV